ncbi:hypothetical protein DER44DRAFT_753546 [Fusarium oxysporum]|nr:hypothetical protein DER44DRAFT_753546 [Fusarium oxysporum]
MALCALVSSRIRDGSVTNPKWDLDIYTAAVWRGIIRCNECQPDVAYLTEVDDGMIDDNGITAQDQTPRNDSQSFAGREDCWLSGLNFITDLYRGLEHALTRLRGYRRRQTTNSLLVGMMFEGYFAAPKASVCESVFQMYLNSPECFRHEETVARKQEVNLNLLEGLLDTLGKKN